MNTKMVSLYSVTVAHINMGIGRLKKQSKEEPNTKEYTEKTENYAHFVYPTSALAGHNNVPLHQQSNPFVKIYIYTSIR